MSIPDTLFTLYLIVAVAAAYVVYREARETLGRWPALAIGVAVGALWPAVALALIFA